MEYIKLCEHVRNDFTLPQGEGGNPECLMLNISKMGQDSGLMSIEHIENCVVQVERSCDQ